MKNVTTIPTTLEMPCELSCTVSCAIHLIPLVFCKVLTIPPTHLIGFALLRIFVDMGASTVRSPINGGGECTPYFGVRPLTVTQRFITPIFLHAGIIHITLNMLAQLTAAAEVRTHQNISVH